MKRLLLNASPRGEKSNSALILSWIAEGIARSGQDGGEPVHLARSAAQAKEALLSAEESVIALPLYTDSIPGLLASFLEDLAKTEPDLLRGKRVAWIVHSGFPESIHGEAVADWLPIAARRLGMICTGILIRGGSEGFRLMPEEMTKKVRRLFNASGYALATTGRLNKAVASRLAAKRTLSLAERAIIAALKPTGLVNLYWNRMLKQHNAHGRRFAAPYGKAF